MNKEKLIRLGFKFLAFKYLLSSYKKVRKQVKLKTRLWCLFKGFSGEKYELYEFQKNNHKLFLSDYQRRKTAIINGRYSIILNDKNLFTNFFEKEKVTALSYGIINKGIITLDDKNASFDEFLELIKEKGKLIIKIFNGGGGNNIFRLEFKDETLILNENKVTNIELNEFINNLNDIYVINEHLQQANYSRKIYPNTINSIRILTAIDPKTNEVIIPVAVHKFGSDTTGPADNVWRGGMTALIDIETGILQKSALHLENNEKVQWEDFHPNTKVKIVGTEIPNWIDVKKRIVKIARLANNFNVRYVGWDVVITEDGIKIIEGNNCSDVNILQIYEPLLKNEKLRKFYQHHNII